MRQKPPRHPHPGRPRGGIALAGAARPPGMADRRDQHAVAGRQHAVLVPAAVSLALLKLLLPFAAVRRRIDPLLNGIATAWVSCHSCWFERIQREPWDVQGNTGLRYADWYLVNCNHQSWVDIFVLQATLNRRIPLLKFFSSSSSSTCR